MSDMGFKWHWKLKGISVGHFLNNFKEPKNDSVTVIYKPERREERFECIEMDLSHSDRN
jgi:hypothetical protein